jgi:acyl carrier protein
VRATELARLPARSGEGAKSRPSATAGPIAAQRSGDVEKPPTSEIERRLAEIWIELLGSEHVGVDDDFFDLGGHSLLATRLIARVHEHCGVQLALRDVFEAPTIQRLAERIGGAMGDSAPVLQSEEDREEMIF